MPISIFLSQAADVNIWMRDNRIHCQHLGRPVREDNLEESHHAICWLSFNLPVSVEDSSHSWLSLISRYLIFSLTLPENKSLRCLNKEYLFGCRVKKGICRPNCSFYKTSNFFFCFKPYPTFQLYFYLYFFQLYWNIMDN